MKSGIYIIHNANNAKNYIGGSVDIPQRWRWHRSALKAGTHHSIHLQRAWDAYGEGSFEFAIIELCPLEHLLVCEQKWIDLYKACDPRVGYNIAETAGRPQFGKKASLDTRAKMSAAQKKRLEKPEERAKNAHFGWHHSLESKAKIAAGSENRAPYVVSAATRTKISLVHKGRKRSAETCAKISAANRARSPELIAQIAENRRGFHHSAATKATLSARVVTEETRNKMKLAWEKRRLRGVSDETRARLSASHKGIVPHNKGQHLSEDAKAKISTGLKTMFAERRKQKQIDLAAATPASGLVN